MGAPASDIDDYGVPTGSDPAGWPVLHPTAEQLPAAVAALRGDGYVQCVDLCGVDYLGAPRRVDLPPEVTPQRFEVVVTLLSHEARRWVRLRVQVPADDPRVPTLFDLFPGTESAEREAFDMFGICFDGHPDPDPHPDARGLARPPAAQGLRRGHRPGAVQGGRGHSMSTAPTAATPSLARPYVRVGGPVLRLSESAALTAVPSAPERMIINMGPQHPSTHGVLRLLLELDGETVLRCKPIIGYLHTGMEKTGETLTYLQGPTNVTRMDYAAPLFTELAFSLATETLLELELPPRAVWIRMLMCELNRMSSHLLFQATNGMDLGAVSMMIYGWREREEVLRLLEKITACA